LLREENETSEPGWKSAPPPFFSSFFSVRPLGSVLCIKKKNTEVIKNHTKGKGKGNWKRKKMELKNKYDNGTAIQGYLSRTLPWPSDRSFDSASARACNRESVKYVVPLERREKQAACSLLR